MLIGVVLIGYLYSDAQTLDNKLIIIEIMIEKSMDSSCQRFVKSFSQFLEFTATLEILNLLPCKKTCNHFVENFTMILSISILSQKLIYQISIYISIENLNSYLMMEKERIFPNYLI